MYHELCDRGKSVFNISSLDSRHSKYRRLLKHGLSGRAIRESEAHSFVQSLAREPGKFQHHLRRNAAAVIMKAAYGYTVSEENDPFIGIAEESAKISGWALAPGRWIVDYYPLVIRFIPSWFPFAGFKRQLNSLSDVPHNWVKMQMERGTHIESFTSRLIRPSPSGPGGSNTADAESEDLIKWAAGGLYAGASDTWTVSALTSFILLIALYPNIQKQAQQEIKVLRYAPPYRIRVIQDDVYQGYQIPKDSTVIVNTWAIFHDPALYPEPFEFNPHRFIDNAKYPDSDVNPDPRGFAFVMVKGLQFAEISILLIMSRVISNFEVSVPAGTVPPVEFTSGITSHLKPFELSIRLRKV
ncbi:cytochrome P450 [Rhodocollybia butyracea]|uniref:Cytochrome P450 n=1 Tax=Rhodocollybia butyracea TaxID=206335 RepID=A0A9P5PWW5_9AGAR|nr:cytochrome P450 [Rhodocollybia butyracea]